MLNPRYAPGMDLIGKFFSYDNSASRLENLNVYCDKAYCKEIENCNCSHEFQVCHSLGGGTRAPFSLVQGHRSYRDDLRCCKDPSSHPLKLRCVRLSCLNRSSPGRVPTPAMVKEYRSTNK
ncbi:hypothetical protein K1719_025844 [Acacia pycnantha]|nr:hypothetical protein K1719_025844 [Acacia pycnantha]